MAIYAFGFAKSVLILKLGYSLNTLITLLSEAFFDASSSALALNNSRCFSIALMHQIPVYSFPCVPPDIVTVLIGVLEMEEATPTCKNAAAKKTVLKKFILNVVSASFSSWKFRYCITHSCCWHCSVSLRVLGWLIAWALQLAIFRVLESSIDGR